jgi:hydroxypyruvate reductase
LLSSGATIHEVNAVRKHLSRLKGGRLAELAQPASVIALMLSDVIGDDLDAIASGPTVGDGTRYEDCLKIIERYHLRKELSAAVIDILERGARGELAETPKPTAEFFTNVHNLIVGSNRLALDAAKEKAQRLGYDAALPSDPIGGESRVAGSASAMQAKKFIARKRAGDPPLCIVSGGETTVTLCGDGLGGRNQEFALAAAMEIAELDKVVVLSAGTDGSDGPTDATGAIVDGMTLRRGRAQGLSAEEFLARNDSYRYLQATGDLLITGPTLTNVMDLQLTLIG